jgi:DMSO/TMAO reductase YedYZ molybdopterin-dependent catalytic subunit
MRSTEFCGAHWLYRPPSGSESPADLKTIPGTGAIVMNESRIFHGFRSHRLDQVLKGRLPPGQYVTKQFPVLSAGPTPRIKLENWTFTLQLRGSLLAKWNWKEFEALPQTTIESDIHCVTK